MSQLLLTECVFSTTDLPAVLAEARFICFCMTQTGDFLFSQLRRDSALIALTWIGRYTAHYIFSLAKLFHKHK